MAVSVYFLSWVQHKLCTMNIWTRANLYAQISGGGIKMTYYKKIIIFKQLSNTVERA